MVLLIGFLMVISAATAIYAVKLHSVFFGLICLIAGSGAILLCLRKPIGRYPFFVVAGLIVLWWSRTTLEIVSEGWPYMDTVSSVISVIPGFLLMSVCIFGSVYIHRITRKEDESRKSGLEEDESA